MSKKKKLGRPRLALRRANKVRQVGRWEDSDWMLIVRAATAADLDTATWCRPILIEAAKKELASR